MVKITDPKYRAFLSGEIMETIPKHTFLDKLENVKHRFKDQARAMLILLWSTGARPNEILSLTGQDFTQENKTLKIKIRGSKGGYSRIVHLSLHDPLAKEVWSYVSRLHPSFFVFFAFRSSSTVKGVKKVLRKKGPDGSIQEYTKHYPKEYPHVSNRLYYWLGKWFDVPPYYFRHNRLTMAAEKLSVNELMLLKGAKSIESVRPYLHLSEKAAKKISRELLK